MSRTSAAAVVVVITLSACQSVSTVAIKSPGPSAAASATSSPVASPLPAVSGLSCSLPISGGTPGSGGFVTFPGGQLKPDAASDVEVPGPAAGGRKSFGLSYDQRYKTWLPVPYDWVSPDGSKYAYPMGTYIALVNVESGRVIQVLGKDKWAYWWPIDVENNGVWAYMVLDSTLEWPKPNGGPFLLPFSGPTHGTGAVATMNWEVYAIRGSVFYDFNGEWWTPGQPSTGALGRSNHTTGQSSFIFGTPYGSASPYVWVGVAKDTAFLITGLPSHVIGIVGQDTSQISVDLGGDFPLVGIGDFPIIDDAHGVWIAGRHGLYLLTPSGAFAASDHTGVLAGGCA